MGSGGTNSGGVTVLHSGNGVEEEEMFLVTPAESEQLDQINDNPERS
jgi:hypothetical protein